MALELTVDFAKFRQALEKAPETMFLAAKRGMHDALDEWRRESVDIAPMDKSTLRKSFGPNEINQDGQELTGEFAVNTVEIGGKGRFNYAYYLHEVKGEIKNPTTPGTEAKFLEIPSKKHGKKWTRDIENEIKTELKKDGW